VSADAADQREKIIGDDPDSNELQVGVTRMGLLLLLVKGRCVTGYFHGELFVMKFYTIDNGSF
jgi:hypothetical protein